MPSDRLNLRRVSRKLRMVQEHLEAMDRDVHGPEFSPWKEEVDHLWRAIFQLANSMAAEPQREALEMVRETWTSYITHYSGLTERREDG